MLMMQSNNYLKIIYLYLIFSHQGFKLLLKSSNTSLKSIGHHTQINRDEWMSVLNESFATDLIIQCLNMVMQMNVKQQVSFQISQVLQT